MVDNIHYEKPIYPRKARAYPNECFDTSSGRKESRREATPLSPVKTTNPTIYSVDSGVGINTCSEKLRPWAIAA
jgi:hypothetical protein